jgi:hypothetical protein
VSIDPLERLRLAARSSRAMPALQLALDLADDPGERRLAALKQELVNRRERTLGHASGDLPEALFLLTAAGL